MAVIEGYNTATHVCESLGDAVNEAHTIVRRSPDLHGADADRVLLKIEQRDSLFPFFVVGVIGGNEEIVSIEYDSIHKGWVVDAIP